MTPLDATIPYSLCRCGCGNKTTIYRGQPRRTISGHQNKSIFAPEIAKAFRIDGVYCRLIPLTQNQWTIVWEMDYLPLMRIKWQAQWNPCTRSFYAVGRFKGRVIRLNRYLAGLTNDDGNIGDHINGITLDNRRTNLRGLSYTGNACNAKLRIDNTSGYKGVSWAKAKNKWAAQIQYLKHKIHLGYYDTPEEAYAIRCEAEQILHGSFARRHGITLLQRRILDQLQIAYY